jgi:Ser/Thr protein kinase RdoA (MazF antagonist)
MKKSEIAEQFNVDGRLVTIRPTGSGNVNDTYLAVFRTTFSEQRFILQRINTNVFAHPEWIMENLSILSNHVHKRLMAEADESDRIWQLPRVIPTRNGQDFFHDETTGYWRAITLIASADCFDRPQSSEHAFEVGSVLGQFHRLVSSMNPNSLRDPLPGFHETPIYLKKYDQTIKCEHARKELSASIEAKRLSKFIEERRGFTSVLQDALERGELHTQLIHGDPKVSNIMIDRDTGKGTAIIDLDTVKPGLIHYDFGDALRSICNEEGEEAEDLNAVVFDLDLCEAFVQGYMQYAADFLSDADRKYLYEAIRLITFELGLRFFEDYLAGNKYFKVSDEGQNLNRARVQFKLCESIETRRNKIQALLD